jgi:hypothetical protein
VLDNIPLELRQYPCWVAAEIDKVPLDPKTGQKASVTDPNTWSTFDQAVQSGHKYVGFVLSQWDPYSIIDLDNKTEDPCTQEQLQRHFKILEAFNSYTERSASGTGYHIVVKGSIPSGVKRDHVEVYSSARYMICTGDVVRNVPIVEYQELLRLMYEEMKSTDESVDLIEQEETLDDRSLVEMAMRAANADKFNDLCNGKWEDFGYPSQSEADLALLSIFAFYSNSNKQCRRLFRMSALGKRDKATRDDRYINYALQKIRAKQPPPIDFDAIKAKLKPVTNGVPHPEVTPTQLSAPHRKVFNGYIKKTELPPGLVGALASYFYETAVRPVPDIALSAAISLAAGIVGRSYNVSGTGLNQYIILVAKTGTGKESAARGIDNLIASTKMTIPMVDQFIGPSTFASGQALIKTLDERPCFVSILGEFGLTLQQICDPNATSAQIMYRKVLLDLYSKSGWSNILRSSVYSDTVKNTKVVQAPNVTILGETTPETFFDGLDSSHISEGLIPRFLVIQYAGNRPPRNKAAGSPPSKNLIEKFSEIVMIALTTNQNNQCIDVSVDPHASKWMDDFDALCDERINGANQDVEIQVWNRAHLKALKLSALIAVGCSPHQPLITADLAEWSINFIKRDVEAMASKFSTGDIGHGDAKVSADLQRVIHNYVLGAFEEAQNYGVDNQMFSDKIIPYCYFIRKTACLAAFRKDRRGSTVALKSAIQDCVDSNLLVEIPTNQLFGKYRARGKAWTLGPGWKAP